MRIIGSATDNRSNASIYYVQAEINEYLQICGENFNDFEIQRKRESHKGYERLKADIKNGTSLPPITLACNLDQVDECLKLFSEGNNKAIYEYLISHRCVSILDGLQRTFLLNDLKEESHRFKKEQLLLLEFRFEKTIKDLIYRIIVLNSGQKPMTIRHQIDVLFAAMRKTMQSKITNLELFQEKEESRRSRARKFSFDRIVMGYQSFMTGSTETEKENIVAQQLMEQNAFSKNEDSLNAEFFDFLTYFEYYCTIDDEVCRIYDGSLTDAPTGLYWLGSENTITAFFTAIRLIAISEERKQRITQSIGYLLGYLKKYKPGDDPLSLIKYDAVVKGFPARRVNIGFATRRLLTNVFKEIFREKGEIDFLRIWEQEAQ